MNALGHPTPLLFSAFVLALLAESWFSWRFLRRLQREHEAIWEASGRRTIWTDGDLVSAWGTVRFLWVRDYAKFCSTKDELRFFERFRMPVVVSWACATLTVAAFLISWMAIGWPQGH